MEKLALEIFSRDGSSSKFATLPSDTSITIIDTSEIFDSGDIWTHSFTLNVFDNAHIFGSAGELHGSRLHEQVDKLRARLWVLSLPIYYGYIRLGGDVEVDRNGNVDISFESGQKTFQDMIEGGKANQVPLMNDVQFGVALWRKRYINWGVGLDAYAEFTDGTKSNIGNVKQDGEKIISFVVDGDYYSTQQYPRMVFPKGHFYSDNPNEPEEVDVNFLNTDFPYTENEIGVPVHPYCNVALCYQRQGYERKQKDGTYQTDYSQEPEAQRGYEYMPANRVNSAPNFYVIYWLRSLMKHLGIEITENQMLGVEDLCRLFFVNTKCAYEEPVVMRTPEFAERYGRYQFGWNRLVPEKVRPRGIINTEDSWFKSIRWEQTNTPELPVGALIEKLPTIANVKIKVRSDVPQWAEQTINWYKTQNGYLHKAFATSECFPDEDIDTTIDAIQNAFGIRLLFDRDYKRVRIVLLRNIFRSSEVHTIHADIVGSITKKENSIRGFRLTFGAGEEDTAYFYRGFADKMPSAKKLWVDNSDKHDYSQWDLNAEYAGLLDKITAFNKTCYVVSETGNAYGIKVDKDAKSFEDMHPSLFGYADYMDAEDGDCTGEEETIEEINVGFKPAILNDINFEEERKGSRDQRFALFVEEEMRPRRPDLNDLTPPASYNDSDANYDVDGKLYATDKDGNYEYSSMMADEIVQPGSFSIASDALATMNDLTVEIPLSVPCLSDQSGKITYKTAWYNVNMDIDGHINEGYRLYLQDNYEPNDDGVSPIETHEWGVTFGIMRGSGQDATLNYEPDEDDGENNDTWDIIPGSNTTTHPDTVDDYGRIFDYNGSDAVITPAQAIQKMPELWPNSNIDLIHQQEGINRTNTTYISGAAWMILDKDSGNPVSVLLATQLGDEGQIDLMVRGGQHISEGDYATELRGKTVAQMYAYDADKANGGLGVIVEIDGYAERMNTLLDLQKRAFVDTENTTPIIIGANGVGSMYGRFSLKLRAEKPNPFYDHTKPDKRELISTKEEAAQAMTAIFTTANTNLLTRPKIHNSIMRVAGWDCPGDGYATVYSMGYGVNYADGTVHEILWTPIKENFSVLTEEMLRTYVNSFNGLSASQIIAHDTEHLILDIDTNEQRAKMLHELQAIYYAEDGEYIAPIVINANPRYLEITNPNLRHRGLADQFYKEYSYWVRNARIAKIPVHMELAQYISIDKTVRQHIGDITGFVKKMQFSVHIQTGMSDVGVEMLYL